MSSSQKEELYRYPDRFLASLGLWAQTPIYTELVNERGAPRDQFGTVLPMSINYDDFIFKGDIR